VPVKVMRLRYAGECSCGAVLAAGSTAGWDTDARRVVCSACLAIEAPDSMSKSAESSLGPQTATLRTTFGTGRSLMPVPH
jgi:hypothetical protein